jgi:predicted phosphodiesterase
VRIAVLNDIHGNVPALQAVLDELPSAGVDRIVVGGDVFPGPMAHLVLRALAECRVPVDYIYGNGEVALLEHLAGKIPARLPEAYRPIVRWNAEQLSPGDRQAIATWPMTLRVTMPAIGDVLFCHATPRDENEIFTARTADDRVMSVFDAAHAPLVVCGHTHLVMDRAIGRTRVVNPGSVGMPFGPAGADWLIIGPEITFRHTNYDLEGAAERIRASGYPAADEFAAKYVLHPPSADEMLALYHSRD